MGEPRQVNLFREVAVRALKASVKAGLILGVYLICLQLLDPVFKLIPGLSETTKLFVTVYVALAVIGELTARTIFEQIFNVARSLLFMLYLAASLSDGVLTVTIENVTLTVDTTSFLVIAIALSTLGFARAIMKALLFLSEKAERDQTLAVKPA